LYGRSSNCSNASGRARGNEHGLSILAAAYAEAGDFDKAVVWQEKANELFSDAEDQKKGEGRLKLYREKEPYREEAGNRATAGVWSSC
jgi:hypothetical protein